MPEGDTLFRAAATLRKALLNKAVTKFDPVEPHLAIMDSRKPVEGRVVWAVEARGKNLLMVFRLASGEGARITVPGALDLALIDTDLVLHTHLRMTGSWHIYRHGEMWQKPYRLAKVVVETDDFVAICFSAPHVELMTAREAARHRQLTALGPDAMTVAFNPAEARDRLRRRPDVAIGVAIMSQSAMAGVGNEFKSEIFFIRRVNPFVAVGEIDDPTLDALVSESHRLLRLNEHSNARRTRFALDERERGWVYGRAGQPCRVCGTSILVRRQGLDGRTTYYCPQCQGVG